MAMTDIGDKPPSATGTLLSMAHSATAQTLGLPLRSPAPRGSFDTCFPIELHPGLDEGEGSSNHGKHRCTDCAKWFSGNTNASEWIAHLAKSYGISGSIPSSTVSSSSGSKRMVQSSFRPFFMESTLRLFENAVFDFGNDGGISLQFAAGSNFKKFVVAVTNG